MMYNIGNQYRIDIIVNREEANFDRACDTAVRVAMYRYGANDDGCLSYVENFQRSTDHLVVQFQTVNIEAGMMGRSCNYIFQAWIERNEE